MATTTNPSIVPRSDVRTPRASDLRTAQLLAARRRQAAALAVLRRRR